MPRNHLRPNMRFSRRHMALSSGGSAGLSGYKAGAGAAELDRYTVAQRLRLAEHDIPTQQ